MAKSHFGDPSHHCTAGIDGIISAPLFLAVSLRRRFISLPFPPGHPWEVKVPPRTKTKVCSCLCLLLPHNCAPSCGVNWNVLDWVFQRIWTFRDNSKSKCLSIRSLLHIQLQWSCLLCTRARSSAGLPPQAGPAGQAQHLDSCEGSQSVCAMGQMRCSVRNLWGKANCTKKH